MYVTPCLIFWFKKRSFFTPTQVEIDARKKIPCVTWKLTGAPIF